MLTVKALTLFLLLVLVGSAWAQSQEIKKPIPPTTNETKGASKTKDNTKGKETITVEFPPAINITMGGKLEVKTENEDTTRNDEGTHLAEWLVALFTGLLVFVTGWLVYYTKNLWGATGKLVIGADNTARHELRAYMGVATNRILKGQGEREPHCVELVIQNFGKTMAKDTQVWINATITNEAITDFPLGERKSKTVVMPHESLGFQHDIGLPKTTPGRIYLWGRIEYKDVFEEPHWTTFRFMDDKSAWLTSMTGQTPGWTTKTCDEGNDAN